MNEWKPTFKKTRRLRVIIKMRMCARARALIYGLLAEKTEGESFWKKTKDKNLIVYRKKGKNAMVVIKRSEGC